jgi:hypothetical protein
VWWVWVNWVMLGEPKVEWWRAFLCCQVMKATDSRTPLTQSHASRFLAASPTRCRQHTSVSAAHLPAHIQLTPHFVAGWRGLRGSRALLHPPA